MPVYARGARSLRSSERAFISAATPGRRSLTYIIRRLRPLAARAQPLDYPNRTVRIVIGFGPGGGTDAVARIVAQKLQELLGGSFLVENKPGASGRLAPDYVAKSAPDGYTLLGAAPGAMTIGTAIWDKIPYNIAIVETQEGVRLTSQVVDCPNEHLRIGMELEVTFEQMSDEVAVPKFRPRR